MKNQEIDFFANSKNFQKSLSVSLLLVLKRIFSKKIESFGCIFRNILQNRFFLKIKKPKEKFRYHITNKAFITFKEHNGLKSIQF